jgi:eukaryotic-like serine/threonine-protein kinase
MTARKIGPFELGDRLGVGGMGIVYRAIYTKTGTPVAIKVLSPDLSDDTQLQARFEREIAILKKLQHPNIVKYYGGGKFGAQRFYAMELVHGGALEKLLKEKRQLPWEQVVEFGLQIVKALEHAHAAGVVHRDLKPANLLLTPEGTLKLTDFGIARDTQATALTAAGRTVGTYAYMAPEQIRGKPPVDRKTDLYALGCVLFEMLTGETPFSGSQQGEVLMAHLQEEPPRVTSLARNCPQWLEDLIFNLLEKNPEDRPYDALQVQVALEDGLKSTTQATVLQPTVDGGSGTKSAEKPKKKKKKKGSKADLATPFYERAWFLGLCLLVLIGGVIWLMQPLGEAQLLARAEPLMASADESNWITARDSYLKPLLERFPEGAAAQKARDYLDKLEMSQAERRASIKAKSLDEADNEAQRLYIDASRYEVNGDRISQLEKYRSMLELLKGKINDSAYRPYLLLAQHKIQQIEEAGTDSVDRLAIVKGMLEKAEDRLAESDKLGAQAIWRSIIKLYSGNQELEAEVKQARARLEGKLP